MFGLLHLLILLLKILRIQITKPAICPLSLPLFRFLVFAVPLINIGPSAAIILIHVNRIAVVLHVSAICKFLDCAGIFFLNVLSHWSNDFRI